MSDIDNKHKEPKAMKTFPKFALLGAVSGASLLGQAVQPVQAAEPDLRCPRFEQHPLRIHNCAVQEYGLTPKRHGGEYTS